MVILGLLSLLHCAGSGISNRTVIDRDSAGGNDYHGLRAKWTVTLRSAHGGPGLMTPMSPGRMPGSEFPLTVSATLMAPPVIEAGFAYYESALNMSPAESDSFRQKYRAGCEPDAYLLVETVIQTSMAESYLDLDRWAVFLEDDAGNSNEPVKIVELPGLTQTVEGMMADPWQKRPMHFDFTRRRKNVLFYFPRKDYYGNPVLHDDLKELKLVFVLEKGGSGRGEGSWIFSEDE